MKELSIEEWEKIIINKDKEKITMTKDDVILSLKYKLDIYEKAFLKMNAIIEETKIRDEDYIFQYNGDINVEPVYHKSIKFPDIDIAYRYDKTLYKKIIAEALCNSNCKAFIKKEAIDFMGRQVIFLD